MIVDRLYAEIEAGLRDGSRSPELLGVLQKWLFRKVGSIAQRCSALTVIVRVIVLLEVTLFQWLRELVPVPTQVGPNDFAASFRGFLLLAIVDD